MATNFAVFGWLYFRKLYMSNLSSSYEHVVSDHDIDSDFEYNFDLNPFIYLLQGIHFLIVRPYGYSVYLLRKISDRLDRIHQEQAFRRTFKGPACMLRKWSQPIRGWGRLLDKRTCRIKSVQSPSALFQLKWVACYRLTTGRATRYRTCRIKSLV